MSLRDAWEEQAQNWLRFATTPDHDRSFWRFGLTHFLELLPPPGRLTIDVGCGEGRLPRILRQGGHRAVGVDASPTLVAYAAELGPNKYVVADAARLPIRDSCADLLVAYMSLHDIDDLEPAIAEIARVMVTGGRFCFAILYPINTAGAYAERTAEAPFMIEDSYLTPRRNEYFTDRGGIPMTFHSEHRPLSTYFEAMAAVGLLAERFLEPSIDDAFVADDSSEVRWRRIPLYLFVSAVKHA
jgi:SAM-dependent methyltransferase